MLFVPRAADALITPSEREGERERGRERERERERANGGGAVPRRDVPISTVSPSVERRAAAFVPRGCHAALLVGGIGGRGGG